MKLKFKTLTVGELRGVLEHSHISDRAKVYVELASGSKRAEIAIAVTGTRRNRLTIVAP